jgi:ribonuclease T1
LIDDSLPRECLFFEQPLAFLALFGDTHILKFSGLPGGFLKGVFIILRTTATLMARWFLALTLLLAAWFFTGLAQAQERAGGRDGAAVMVTDLPIQGQRMYRLILLGGPFAHDKDGVVFGNRERLLPLARRGYYREYTVETPGARNRGTRRIVCGGSRSTAPDACWYTGDHYASFLRIVQ